MPQGYLGGVKLWVTEAHKTASYTVVAADTGTLFIVDSGTPTFTLPSLATGGGLICWFINVSATVMTVTAPSGKLIMDGSAGATSASNTTATHIIGSALLVFMNDPGTFYHCVNIGGTAILSA